MLRTAYYLLRPRRLFTGRPPEQSRFATTGDLPEAPHRFAIFFTPRCGSTHLAKLIAGTKAMGDPGEAFNPLHVQASARAMGSRDLTHYIAQLVRVRNVNGFFGVKLSYAHLIQVFRSERRFLDLVAPEKLIWVIRRDIVAQAVSAYGMKQSGIAHSPHSAPEEIAEAQSGLRYDGRRIRWELRGLLWNETRTEAMLERRGLRALHLSYEGIVQGGPEATLRRVAGHLGIEGKVTINDTELHRKIGGKRNVEFAARFRAENPGFLRRVEARRAPMLERFEEV